MRAGDGGNLGAGTTVGKAETAQRHYRDPRLAPNVGGDGDGNPSLEVPAWDGRGRDFNQDVRHGTTCGREFARGNVGFW